MTKYPYDIDALPDPPWPPLLREKSAELNATFARARPAKRESGPYAFHWHGEPSEEPLEAWLVERALPEKGTALLSGQWGTYKTFVALDLAGAVMTATPFAGRAVKRQGGVLFIAAEGEKDVRLRLEGVACERVANAPARDGVHFIRPDCMPFAWIKACPPLTDENTGRELGAIVADAGDEMQDRFGLPLVLIIIDTMMAAAGFKDANDAAEAQNVMSMLAWVSLRVEALVLVVDHFGKNVETGTRNSSAKEASAEAVLALLGERDPAGRISNPRLTIRKSRGAPTGEEIPFQVRTVTVYENSGHDAVTTLAIDWNPPASAAGDDDDAPRRKTQRRRGSKALMIFNRVLNNCMGAAGKCMRPFPDGPEVLAVTRETVRAEFMRTYPADDRKAKGEAFRRCEETAIADGLIMAREIGLDETAETFLWRLNPNDGSIL